jgi:ABC-type branched-subunit amino acid transport system substrate-binding protein
MRRRSLVLSAAGIGLGLPTWSAGSDNDILLGRLAPLSDVRRPALRDFQAGIQLALDSANARGGIGGRKLRWVPIDTQQSAQMLTVKVQRLATEPGFVAWLGPVGPMQGSTLAQMPADTRAPAVGGLGLVDSQREQVRGWHFHVRASQAREAEMLARHLATVRLSRVAVVCPSDPAGANLAVLLSVALGREGIKTLAQATVTSDSATVQEATRKLMALDPQALVLALPAAQAVEMMEMAAALKRHPGFFAMSMGGEETIAASALKNASGLAVAQVVPYPWSQTDAQILAYRRLCEPAQVKVGYASLEGFITAQVLIEALRRCGRELGPSQLRATLAMLQMNWGGMEIDFSRGEIGGSRFVEMVQVGPGGRYIR